MIPLEIYGAAFAIFLIAYGWLWFYLTDGFNEYDEVQAKNCLPGGACCAEERNQGDAR